MGHNGIDSRVQPYYNQHKEDAILVNVYQTTNDKISNESRAFAEGVEARIISLFNNEVELAA
jgi:hypothetical protein